MSKGLSNTSRASMDEMFAQMAKTYGVGSVHKQFAVDPAINQQLQDAIVESSEFLQLINLTPVLDLKGQKVLGGAAGGPGRRTDTDDPAKSRVPQDLMTMGNRDYELFPTEFDYLIKYSKIDAWARYPDLSKKYGEWVRQNIALARIMVGWHGLSAATETDPDTNLFGEDLNIGWLQLLRNYNGGAQVLSDGATAGSIKIGATGDYENLDSAVLDVHSLLNPIYQGSDKLVCLVGRELLTSQKATLYANHGGRPTEKEKRKIEESTNEFAGIPRGKIPAHFPDRGLLVTPYENLSIYHQEDSWRRHIEDNPSKNRVDEFNSVNEGYVIEDEENMAMIEFANVQLKNAVGDWA